MRPDQLKVLASRGIIVPEYAEYLKDEWRDNPDLALDAQPTLVTAQNIGIPAYLANLVDPKTVRALVTPMKAAMIYGETKKGTWTTLTAQFPVVETTGQVSSYNDNSEDGNVGSNYNWVPRQSYHFQTVTRYGDRETEMFGLAQINYVADLNFSSVLILSKFMNTSYFFGVQGMQNYGGLNDPSLIAPISPAVKAAGGTSWNAATAVEVFNDVLALYVQLQTQLPALIDRDTKMTLALSNTSEPNMGKVTSFTLAPVRQAIKENWPNLRIMTAPEYNTASGQLMQLIADELDGDKTSYSAFTEKLRPGRVVPKLSSFMQKKVAGTWGTIIRRPIAIASMLGI